MEYPFHIGRRFGVALLIAGAIIVIGFFLLGSTRNRFMSVVRVEWARMTGFPFGHGPHQASAKTTIPSDTKPKTSETTVELSASQRTAIKIGTVGTYSFPVNIETVGNIDFDKNLWVQVFPTFPGTIIETFAVLGNEVRKDQILYTIKSSDLIQAQSGLIAAAASLEVTSRELVRVTTLKNQEGVSEREFEQATSDEKTAEGALRAARDAVRVFGKTEADIDKIIATRQIDPALVVRSPINGKITSRDAQPGLLVQPGNPPAPYSVADMTVKWMLASVPEAEIAHFRLGQPVQARVMAYPDRLYKGKVSKIYPTADLTTHRIIVRSEIEDPYDELSPGMLATFVIQVGSPVKSLTIPANGVVREGDGTMTAWVTTDRQHFSQRVIKVGLRRDGWVQILAGLQRGESVVTDGAVFLSNMLQMQTAE